MHQDNNVLEKNGGRLEGGKRKEKKEGERRKKKHRDLSRGEYITFRELKLNSI